MFDHLTEDLRGFPTYKISEVAHYLGVPPPTIRYWSVGRGPYEPLIELPESSRTGPTLLSFFNLVELHVLAAIRRKHGVAMPKVRKAIKYLMRTAPSSIDQRHPLISYEMETDGLDLFIERYGQLINISQAGQLAMRELIETALDRIDRDSHKVPIRLFPFTRTEMRNAPEMVVIDPRLSAGRPVIAGTGLTTQIIAERYKAGESVSQLAQDYGRDESEIQEALRCEIKLAA
ncbi:MAG: DUF433 domain-containing protein [Candidatus Aminicenantes bacterium]|nr:DUF433 domain-containing protein [Candidatus Aminicenantes bacterium]